MNKSTRQKMTGLVGLIVIAVTFITFFMDFGNGQKETIDYMAFTFILISELVLFGTLIFMDNIKNKTNRLFLNAGIISTLAVYWIVTTLISIFLTGVFKDNVNVFIIIQIVILALSAIIVLLIIMSSSALKDKSERAAECSILLQESERIVFSLKNNRKYSSFERELSKLYDELKFCDKSSYMQSEDSEINTQISELKCKLEAEENKDQNIKVYIDDIILMIKNRNMAVKQQKSGGGYYGK